MKICPYAVLDATGTHADIIDRRKGRDPFAQHAFTVTTKFGRRADEAARRLVKQLCRRR